MQGEFIFLPSNIFHIVDKTTVITVGAQNGWHSRYKNQSNWEADHTSQGSAAKEQIIILTEPQWKNLSLKDRHLPQQYEDSNLKHQNTILEFIPLVLWSLRSWPFQSYVQQSNVVLNSVTVNDDVLVKK